MTWIEVIEGGAGTVADVNADVAVDAVEVPHVFVAVTVHVYVFGTVSDDTISGLVEPIAVRVVPPSDDAHEAA
jgi:hypothetical protein